MIYDNTNYSIKINKFADHPNLSMQPQKKIKEQQTEKTLLIKFKNKSKPQPATINY